MLDWGWRSLVLSLFALWGMYLGMERVATLNLMSLVMLEVFKFFKSKLESLQGLSSSFIGFFKVLSFAFMLSGYKNKTASLRGWRGRKLDMSLLRRFLKPGIMRFGRSYKEC